jgi:hypothetical protein
MYFAYLEASSLRDVSQSEMALAKLLISRHVSVSYLFLIPLDFKEPEVVIALLKTYEM